MPDRPTEDLPRFVLDLDDIADVAELELPDVKTPAQPLAAGSELRSRVIAQDVPNDIDLALMAYLLDIDVPPDPPTPPWPVTNANAGAGLDGIDTIDDDSIDESPTPRYRG